MSKYGKNNVYLVNIHLYQVTDHLQTRNIREYFIIVTAKCIKYPLSKIYELYKLVSINSGNHSFSHFIIFDELVRWMNKNNLCKLIPLKTTIVTKPTNSSSEKYWSVKFCQFKWLVNYLLPFLWCKVSLEKESVAH